MSTVWACLVKIKAKDGQRAHLIAKDSFVIGRAQESDLPVVSPGVSRQHLGIEVRADGVFITDQKSANGTFLNGKKLEPGQSVLVTDKDIVRLGATPEELQFVQTPVPFEMLNQRAQQNVLSTSMDAVAKDLEARAREKYEREIERGQAEAERMIAKAKRDSDAVISRAKLDAEEVISQANAEAEILKTEALVDAQARKRELEREIALLQQQSQAELAQQRVLAKKEADRIVGEAQKRIQKDYEDSARQMQERFAETQQQCSEMLNKAETQAQEILSESQAEASRLRIAATEEARTIHQEALKKSNEVLKTLEANFQRENQDKRNELLERARTEAQQERDRILTEFGPRIEELRSELAETEAEMREKNEQLADLDVAAQALRDEKANLTGALQELGAEVQAAKDLIARVDELTHKRDQAEMELKRFTQTRDEGLAKIDRELQEIREKRILEFERLRSDQDQDLAKQRLKAIEDINKHIEKLEAEYERTLHLRSVELSQKLYDRFIPLLENWRNDPSSASGSLRKSVEAVVHESMLKESTTFQAIAMGAPEVDEETLQKKKKQKKRLAIAGTAAALILGLIYGADLFQLMKDAQKDSYASAMIEKRRLDSIYQPEQTDEYRNTYTDNVLYMRSYYDTKLDLRYQEQWALRLNDLKLLRDLQLTEEEMILLVAKETNLVRRLGELRDKIDAVYLDEGIRAMREAEDEAMKEIREIVKKDKHLEKIRRIEEGFLKKFNSEHEVRLPADSESVGESVSDELSP